MSKSLFYFSVLGGIFLTEATVLASPQQEFRSTRRAAPSIHQQLPATDPTRPSLNKPAQGPSSQQPTPTGRIVLASPARSVVQTQPTTTRGFGSPTIRTNILGSSPQSPTDSSTSRERQVRGLARSVAQTQTTTPIQSSLNKPTQDLSSQQPTPTGRKVLASPARSVVQTQPTTTRGFGSPTIRTSILGSSPQSPTDSSTSRERQVRGLARSVVETLDTVDRCPEIISGRYLNEMLNAPYERKGTGGGGVTEVVGINANGLQWGSIKTTQMQLDSIKSTLINLTTGKPDAQKFINEHVKATLLEIPNLSYISTTAKAISKKTGLDANSALIKYLVMLDDQPLKSTDTSMQFELFINVTSVQPKSKSGA